MKESISATKAVLMVGALLLGVAWHFGFLRSSAPVAAPARVQAPRVTLPVPVVTKAEFDRLETGMSLDVVEAIVGAPGELRSSSEMGDLKTVLYAWKNTDGSNMSVMFQNSKMVSKSQYGLR